MYRVNKHFEFPAAHVLSKHPGRCKYPHGHNYKVEVTLSSPALDENDMVCDFHALKAMIADCLDELDHSTLLNSQDTASRQFFQDHPRCITFPDRDPTTEVLAETIFMHLQSKLQQTAIQVASGVEYKIDPRVKLEKVRIWESNTGWAEFQRD